MVAIQEVWIYQRKNFNGWWVGWYESGRRRSKALPNKALAEHFQKIKYQQLTFVQPWYPGKSAPSFSDALSCLRRVLWRDRIKFMFGKRFVHNKNFEFLIEALATAA